MLKTHTFTLQTLPRYIYFLYFNVLTNFFLEFYRAF